MRKRYTVYRLDHVTGRYEAIGSILERRRADRSAAKNMRALLVEARRLFGGPPDGAHRIVLDPTGDSRGLPMDETKGEPDLVHAGDSPDFQVAWFGQTVEKGGDND